MDNRILAAIVAAVIVICGITAFVVYNGGEKTYDGKAINAIGRMNNDGSGLYIDSDILEPDQDIPTNVFNGVPFFTMVDDQYAVSEENQEAWGGLVFGDPEIHSIQHAQIVGIAQAMGLKVQEYTDGTVQSDDTLYYITDLYNYELIIGNDFIDGGIIWEPVHQRLISDSEDTGYSELQPTKKIFDWHVCSIIGANHDWLMKNHDTAVKFLAAYKESTELVNTILEEKGKQYEELIATIVEKSPGYTKEEIENALENVTFLCADDDKGSLEVLKDDVRRLGIYLDKYGMITSDKFKDPEAFAKAFVDDRCIRDACAGKAGKEGSVTVKLPQVNLSAMFLSLIIGEQAGIYEKYGVTLEYVPGEYTAGEAVVEQLMDGKIDIGFFGAPPAMEAMINGEHIVV